MSKSPHALAGVRPTMVDTGAGGGYRLCVAFFRKGAGRLSPVEYGVVVPARAAYSHSASVGRRYGRLSFLESHWQKRVASCQFTKTTASLSSLEKPSLPRNRR